MCWLLLTRAAARLPSALYHHLRMPTPLQNKAEILRIGSPPQQAHDAAEALLYVCRRLWGQPHVAPIYAMLLHQWLLLRKDAGGAEQRLKHLKVMVSGALRPSPGPHQRCHRCEQIRVTLQPVQSWVTVSGGVL